jgi:hypothetical protein
MHANEHVFGHKYSYRAVRCDGSDSEGTTHMFHSGTPIGGASFFPLTFESKASIAPVMSEAGSTMFAGLTERSVFHEPWWLDTTTNGHWQLAVVKSGDEVVAELPYALNRKGLWRISTQPPLTRTLGPVIKPSKSPSEQDWRHRVNIASELISTLPKCALIQQTLDTRIAEAIGFSLHGFSVSTSFTLKLQPNNTEESTWKGMRANTRNLIRRAAERLNTMEMTNADAFVDFYEANLSDRKRKNVYGTALMRKLVSEVLKRKAGMVLGAYGADGKLSAAIVLVWDNSTIYYLLSTRAENAHGGATAMLLWIAIRFARERNLVFDFDGIPNLQIMKFVSGFGGMPAQRLMVERIRPDYAAIRATMHCARRCAGLDV